MMTEIGQFYVEKHGFHIFKKTSSMKQLIQQGEIDALGLCIQGRNVQEIFAVDVAFHEGGLNYGGKVSTVEKIVKKIVRSAMILYGFYDMKSGNIVFASPKINRSILEPLEFHLEELQTLFKQLGFDYRIELYTNHTFQSEILNPVINLSSTIADTSELFLRSMQLHSMFIKQ